eukprot:scaffold24945_cov30-Phaeocystis_antarctica.AAC.1
MSPAQVGHHISYAQRHTDAPNQGAAAASPAASPTASVAHQRHLVITPASPAASVSSAARSTRIISSLSSGTW